MIARLEKKTGIRVNGGSEAADKYRAMINLPKLHPAQQRIISESRRYNVANCGRRFGKTFMAAEVLIDGPRQKGCLHGYPVALYAPTYQTMLESWRTMVSLLQPITAKKSEQDKRIDLITGGVVEFWSLDNPDAGRGRRYSVIVVDEAAMIKRLEEAWSQNIQPLLLDFQGEAWFVSTPKGDNFYHSLYMRGDASNPAREEDWMSWKLPTWENPYINRDDIEQMRKGMPQLAYLQEICADFVSFAGTFIKAEHIHVGQFPEGMKLYQGVDLAISMKENADYTAVVTVGVDEKTGRVWMVDAERRRVGFRDALDFIKEKAYRWRPEGIAVEVVQYQAAVVEELLRSTSLPVFKVRPDKDKLTRAQSLITRYENGLVWHSENLPPEFANELLSFGPDCEHDDMVDAAVYAYMQTSDYGRPMFILPDEPKPSDKQAEIQEAMPGLPSNVVAMVDNLPSGVCGRCSSYDVEAGRCKERNFTVKERDPACDIFVSIDYGED